MRIEKVDIECHERILNCLSHYISNIGYRYKWKVMKKQQTPFNNNFNSEN